MIPVTISLKSSLAQTPHSPDSEENGREEKNEVLVLSWKAEGGGGLPPCVDNDEGTRKKNYKKDLEMMRIM